MTYLRFQISSYPNNLYHLSLVLQAIPGEQENVLCIYLLHIVVHIFLYCSRNMY